MTELTFLMIKPDGVKRKLVGEIISRFEKKNFELVALNVGAAPLQAAREHYKEHSEKPFFRDLVNFLTSGQVVVMVWRGENIVSISRQMIGATNPKDRQPGTIRGDYSCSLRENVIHGSDSNEAAEREIEIWFPHILNSLKN